MKKLFFFAAVAATMVACSSDNGSEAPKNDTIRLTTTVAGVTRSTSQTLQATQIENGQNVLVKLSYDGTATNEADWGTSSPFANTSVYTADGAGVLNGATIKWPTSANEEGKVVTAEAWAPVAASATAAPTTFEVKADQTADADYVASDFLYGKTAAGSTFADVVTSGNPITIGFSHKLAKINVNVSGATDDAGAAIDPAGASIVIGTASLKLSGDIANGNVTATGTKTGAVTMTSALETAKTASAIIIPQDITGDLLTIKLGTATYVYKLTAAKTFEAGKVYTYTVSLRGNGSIIILNEKITDWTAETPETVVATKES